MPGWTGLMALVWAAAACGGTDSAAGVAGDFFVPEAVPDSQARLSAREGFALPCAPGCAEGEICIEGACVQTFAEGGEAGAEGGENSPEGAEGFEGLEGGACLPGCAGRLCGTDGCGGICGSCGIGQACDLAGLCVCAPTCSGKGCGDDGCGGNCGDCPAPQVCNTQTFICVANCVPSCVGRNCGTDGCGGSCGSCATGQACLPNGQCQCAPQCQGKACGPDGCGGICGTCGPGLICGAIGQCEPCRPFCTGLECGPDGCGGECGTCAAGTFCSAGLCSGTPPPPDSGVADPPDTGVIVPPTDAGVIVEPPDSGTPPPQDAGVTTVPQSVILAGQGVDLNPQGGATISVRVGSDFANVSGALGGPGTPTVVDGKPSEFSRDYTQWGITLLYLDIQDDNVAGPGDRLNRIIIGDKFVGATPSGRKVGDPASAWQGELGGPDKSVTADTGEILDTWFLKGITLGSRAGNAISVSIFKPTAVVPNAPIEYKSYRLGAPLNIQGDIPDGQDFSSVEGKLGPADITGRDGNVRTKTWVDLGITIINGNDANTVNAIAVTQPYFGLVQGTQLKPGSTRQDVIAALGQPTGTKTENGINIEYYKVGEKTIVFYTFVRALGVIYTDTGKVGSFMVDYAFEK